MSIREDARDWERLLRAQAVTGSLPRRAAVRDYAAQWIAGYDTAPANTRRFHEVNLEHIVAGLGAARVSEVTPSDITRRMNHLITDRSAALGRGPWGPRELDDQRPADRAPAVAPPPRPGPTPPGRRRSGSPNPQAGSHRVSW